MENPSPSNVSQNSASRRRVRLIPAPPRPALPPIPSAISSSSDSTPSTAFSGHPRAESPRGVVPGTDPDPRLTYPLCLLIGSARNEESRHPAPVHQYTPAAGRHIPPTSEAGPSRPPSTFGGRLYADIIREAMARIPLFTEGEEESVSPAPLSSLRFSTGDDADGESADVSNGRKRGRTFEEIAEEVIRDMRKAEEDERQQLRGRYEVGGPSQPAARVNNEDSHRSPIREMLNLVGTDDKVETEEDEWRRNLEATVDILAEEVAAQREQTAKLTNLMERVVSWMDRETQSSNNPAPATSVAPVTDSQPPNNDVVGPSRKRKEGATASQPARTNKRNRNSGSPGGQSKN